MDLDCKKVEDEEIIERYLTDQLSQEEVEAFEQHYLSCERCFSELQLRHAAAAELRNKTLRPAAAKSQRIGYRWRWALAATVVVIFAVVLVFYLYRGAKPDFEQVVLEQPPESAQAVLKKLASVEQPPPYVPWTIRGAKGKQASEMFQKGMKEYGQQKYQEAVPFLEDAARQDPDHLPTAFYLGISYLMIDQPDQCVQWLSNVVHSEPNPYAEESHWYLSKAYFKKLNLDAARRELEAVVDLNGAYASEAKKALQLMQELSHVQK